MNARAPIDSETRRVRVNGVQLHCQIGGSGEPLLFIHGLGSCADDWKPQLDFFRQRYRTIACDLRGHGRSSKPDAPYSIETFAGDVESLLRELEVDAAHVVGISLGGMVAFQLAVDAPERVCSLAIVNSGPAVPAATFRQKLPLRIRLVYAHLFGMRAMAAKIAKGLFPKPGQAELQRAFVARLVGNDKRCYLASLRAIFAGWTVADRLRDIRCPVLVLASDNDYTPVALKEAYAGRLPDARLVVVADAHHALPIEKPDEFNDVLASFLASLKPAHAPARSMQAAT